VVREEVSFSGTYKCDDRRASARGQATIRKKETFLANCAELAENGPVVFLVSSMEDCKQRFRNGKS
jgi:hypothetical protein